MVGIPVQMAQRKDSSVPDSEFRVDGISILSVLKQTPVSRKSPSAVS